MSSSTPVCQIITWATNYAQRMVLECQYQPAEDEWLRGLNTEERQEIFIRGSNRKWGALALKCHYVSLDTLAFPEKNRDVQIGEADNWMCIDVEKCLRWKMTTLNFHSLIECQSSSGKLLFLYLELSCCAEIHTYAWKLNVDTTKLQKFSTWTIYKISH